MIGPTFRGSNSTIIDNSELQIRGDIEDNSKIFFLFLNENICCDPSLESTHQGGSNHGSQNMILCRNMANYP